MKIPVPFGKCILQFFFNRGKKIRNYRIFIFLLTLLIYACYHISRRSVSVVKSVLHQQNCSSSSWNYNHTNTSCGWAPFDGENWSQLIGTIDFSYLLAYSVGMMASGHIAERVHITYFLTIGMFLTGISSSLFGLGYFLNIHVFTYYIVVQIFAGAMQGTGWPPVVACMENWFGKRRRGFIMGVWNLHVTVGNVLGSLIAGAFVEFNWGLSFIVPGVICCAMGFVVFFLLTPYPSDVNCHLERGADSDNEDDENESLTVEVAYAKTRSAVDLEIVVEDETKRETSNGSENTALLRALSNQPISIISAFAIPGVLEYALCLFFSKLVSYTFLFWLPNYIRDVGGFVPSAAADLSTMFDVGGIIGGILAGYLSDVIGSSAIPCTLMHLLAIPALMMYYQFGAINIYFSIGLLIVMGVFVYGPYCLITTAVSADLGTHSSLSGNTKAVAMVSAIIDSTGSLGAAIGPILCGLLYPYGWGSVFIILIVCLALAVLLLSRRTLKELRYVCKKSRSSL